MQKDMLIKVCGMREPENIRQVKDLGVNLIGMIFYAKSPRYVSSIPVSAGIIPNMVDRNVAESVKGGVKTVGVFVDEMPQTVVTQAYNYGLDYIQLHGNESPVYIENLKRTLVPDILPDVKIIKALSIREADDVKRWRQYEDTADVLLFDTKCETMGGSGKQFDWTVLEHYDGELPFLLSGGIGPEDVERVKKYCHPRCIGIDINSKFEDAPAQKNVEWLREFITKVRN